MKHLRRTEADPPVTPGSDAAVAVGALVAVLQRKGLLTDDEANDFLTRQLPTVMVAARRLGTAALAGKAIGPDDVARALAPGER